MNHQGDENKHTHLYDPSFSYMKVVRFRQAKSRWDSQTSHYDYDHDYDPQRGYTPLVN